MSAHAAKRRKPTLAQQVAVLLKQGAKQIDVRVQSLESEILRHNVWGQQTARRPSVLIGRQGLPPVKGSCGKTVSRARSKVDRTATKHASGNDALLTCAVFRYGLQPRRPVRLPSWRPRNLVEFHLGWFELSKIGIRYVRTDDMNAPNPIEQIILECRPCKITIHELKLAATGREPCLLKSAAIEIPSPLDWLEPRTVCCCLMQTRICARQTCEGEVARTEGGWPGISFEAKSKKTHTWNACASNSRIRQIQPFFSSIPIKRFNEVGHLLAGLFTILKVIAEGAYQRCSLDFPAERSRGCFLPPSAQIAVCNNKRRDCGDCGNERSNVTRNTKPAKNRFHVQSPFAHADLRSFFSSAFSAQYQHPRFLPSIGGSPTCP